MNFEQSNNSEIARWAYLLNIVTLTQYLRRKDLIELSKCCKRYRNQLERQVLENLDLSFWDYPFWASCDDLYVTETREKTLSTLKADLGIKLKFAKKVILNCDIDFHIAKEFIKLLPNVKSLKIIKDFDGSFDINLGLITILNGMEYLTSVEFFNVMKVIGNISTKLKVFPKMIKSVKIISQEEKYVYNGLTIYDTIDASYVNLYSLTIVSNVMLQNLACGVPNLQEVEVNVHLLDTPKLKVFLKANPQIRKLTTTDLKDYNDEIFKAILSSKRLEYWYINNTGYEKIAVYNLPSNFSIKYLKVYGDKMSSSTNYQVINACKSLETLDIGYGCFEKLDLSKFERRIGTLNLSFYSLPRSTIIKIDTSRMFTQIHLYTLTSIEEFVYQFNFYKLINYRLIPMISGPFILKLIN